ncbi:MAG: TRAP-type C4-dicarboxylate transport system, periplasmic component [Firmicutes bacterium]|nr:TRAP-type C4-dicarboxylate transport system, periplasmic component [Bacillota bacterium]
MKKSKCLSVILILVFALSLVLTGCGGSKPQTANEGEVEPRILKLGHKSSDTHSWQLGSEKFAELVKERTNGELIIEIYPNSQLGDQKEMTEAAQIGVVDFVLNAPATLSGFIPEMGALDLPFLFRDYDHAFKALDTVGMEYYAPLCEEVGLKLLAFWDTGFKNLSNNKLDIQSVDDIKNLKIRYAGGASLAATIEALGASAISIPWSETYIALSQGTADAQFNPPSTMVESKIHEVQKYYSSNLTVQYGAEPVVMSLKTWNELTTEQQQIIMEACQEARDYQRELNKQMDKEALQQMIDEGVIVTEISDDVLAQIQEMTAPVLAKHGDPKLVSAIQAIK